MATPKAQRFTPYVPDLGQPSSNQTSVAEPKNEELEGMLKSLMTEMRSEAPAAPAWEANSKSPKKYNAQPSNTQPDEMEGMLKSLMTELRKNKQETGENYWAGMKPSTLPPFDFKTNDPEEDEFEVVSAGVAPAPERQLIAELDDLGDALEAALAKK